MAVDESGNEFSDFDLDKSSDSEQESKKSNFIDRNFIQILGCGYNPNG